MRAAASLLIVVCGVPMAAAATAGFAATQEVVDAVIRPILEQREVPGLAVAVTVGGRTMVFNYGVASRESGRPVGETTLFELGSLSKTFTATLALYAQALGKLSLSDHPGKYMPELKGHDIDRATLLDLGTYCAGGLPLQFPEEISDHESMVRYFQNWKSSAEPGTQREYSNPSIGLLGHITGLAVQSDFANAVETALLPRLGLHNTHVRVPQAALPDYAWGYDKQDRPVRVNPGMFDAQAYGIKSTAADMIRFVQLNIDAGGLEEPVRRAVEGTHSGSFDVAGMVQGLGWEQYSYPVSLERLLQGNSSTVSLRPNAATQLAQPQTTGPRLFNKTGSTGGFGAYVAFVPQKRIGIVLLSNRNYPIADRVRAAFTILGWLALHTD